MTKASEYTIRDDFRDRKKDALPLPQQLVALREKTGRGSFSMVWEWFGLSRGGKLTFDEYVQYRLYDDELFTKDEKRAFVSDRKNLEWTFKVNDASWIACSEDKWLMYSILRDHDLPVPETRAIATRQRRDFGAIPVLASADDLREFARKNKAPLFIKPVAGVASSGADIITAFTEDGVVLKMAGEVSHAAFMDDVVGGDNFLIQTMLENHPVVQAISDGVATVRCFNFMYEDRLDVKSVVIKLCGKGNVADNYWRAGNMIADVDPATGEMVRAVMGSGLSHQEITEVPEAGAAIVGVRLPHWEDALALNARCAHMFAGLRFSSTDIALTPDGPVVVEVNNGGAMMLPQIAQSKGYLTDDVKAYFGV